MGQSRPSSFAQVHESHQTVTETFGDLRPGDVVIWTAYEGSVVSEAHFVVSVLRNVAVLDLRPVSRYCFLRLEVGRGHRKYHHAGTLRDYEWFDDLPVHDHMMVFRCH